MKQKMEPQQKIKRGRCDSLLMMTILMIMLCKQTNMRSGAACRIRLLARDLQSSSRRGSRPARRGILGVAELRLSTGHPCLFRNVL